MCGIAAVLHRYEMTVAESDIKEMLRAQSHRGPDDKDLFVHGPVGMGQVRLSIMDPRRGRCVITNEAKSLFVVYNGEIYNHRGLRKELEAKGYTFPNQSDGEIIPALFEVYGPAAFEKIQGMFAFLIYDAKGQKAYVVRDRLGIKPLVWFQNEGSLVFASEIKGLLAHPNVPRAIDPDAVHHLLVFGYPMGPGTIFKGLNSFPAGSWGVFDLADGSFKITSFWKPTFAEPGAYAPLNWFSAKQAFKKIFREVIADHLDADVPVSFYLSGGIDSSGVTAQSAILRREKSEKVRAFSLRFPRAARDEFNLAESLAHQIGFDIQKVMVPEDSLESLEQTILKIEQPQIFTLDMANQRLSETVREEGFKVVLTGDGADELLGGYDHFVANVWARRFMPLPRPLRHLLMRVVLRWLGYPKDFHPYFIRILEEETPLATRRYGFRPPWYPIWRKNADIATPLMAETPTDPLGESGPLVPLCATFFGEEKNIAPLNKDIALEMRTRLPWWVLWKSDRNAMANGVEARVPYLDNRMINFFASLPPHFKMGLRREKRILRCGFEDFLPRETCRRRKFAFNTPPDWLFAKGREGLNKWLGAEAIEKTALFKPVEVERLLALVESPEKSVGKFHYALSRQTLIGVLTTQMLLLGLGFTCKPE